MDNVELIGRVLLSLGVVLGLIWMIARRARGNARTKIRSDKLIDVLGRQSLNRTASMAVVRVADRALIVGIAEQSVTVMGELELDAVSAHLHGLADPAPHGGGQEPAGPGPADPAVPDDVSALTDGSGIPASLLRGNLGATGGGPTPSRGAVRGAGPLAGSALSPTTWRQTVDALREMTTRKG